MPQRHVIRGIACQRCGVKYAQERGLCRTCSRTTGVYTLTTQEAERDRIARRIARQTPRCFAAPAEWTPKTRIVDGVEYEVTFDGT